ncbi:MAG: PD-(D/E)XK nuclease family protein [Anaerolineaceae bacterium]|nr:PD-(D/E)XK nuclease family protein [Anaerolineaceae bacterium]
MKNEYSQNKLHDYLECPRRYELKYLIQRVWPAVLSEPVLEMEQQIKNGKKFHLLAQQYFSGINQDDIVKQIDDEKMNIWWDNFIQFADQFLSLPHQPEVLISSIINSYRFKGVFDLLVYSPGEKFIIVDWKTNQHKPDKKLLEQHIQTRLYPLILAQAGEQWNNNQKILPGQIEMIYWFANYPDGPETFTYSQHNFQMDLDFVQNLVQKIENTKINEFELTKNEKTCLFCNYRSLCSRGTKPGNQSESNFLDIEYFYEEIDEIDMNLIGEIAF